MMAWSQLGHMANVYDFISTSMNTIISKLSKMVDQHQHALIFLYGNDDVTTARSRSKY